MKKILCGLIFGSFISLAGFAQEKVMYQKDSAVPMNVVHVKKIKELGLSKQQKKEVKKYRRSDKEKEVAIKNNAALSEQQKKEQLMLVKKDRHEKLEAILTPEQKEKIKQMKKDQPRRGVTNMPNERTIKQ